MFSGLRSVCIRFKSCRTKELVLFLNSSTKTPLTSHASEELSGKTLNLTVGERYKGIAFEEVKNALAQEICDDANMTPIIETISEVYTPIPVLLIICLEGSKNPKLDLASIAVLLDGANDLDSNFGATSPIRGLDDFTKSTLT